MADFQILLIKWDKYCLKSENINLYIYIQLSLYEPKEGFYNAVRIPYAQGSVNVYFLFLHGHFYWLFILHYYWKIFNVNVQINIIIYVQTNIINYRWSN